MSEIRVIYSGGGGVEVEVEGDQPQTNERERQQKDRKRVDYISGKRDESQHKYAHTHSGEIEMKYL